MLAPEYILVNKALVEMDETELKIEEIRSHLGIDKRTCIFELSEDLLKISDKKVAEKVKKILKRFGIKIPIKLLPEEEQTLKFGISNVGTAPVFKEPSMKSEQVTQIILGETFDVLETFKEEWLRIRLHFDGYIGWVYKPQVVMMNEEKFSSYLKKKKVQFIANFGFIYSKPNKNSTAIRDIVICSTLNVIDEKGRWLMVELPDGAYGWLSKDEVKKPNNISVRNGEKITKTAKRFLGISYLWGGKTPKGFDCSGFVQTAFRINGIYLPRDSDMQWKVGRYVGKNFKKFKSGDLLFFSSDGDRITHVGIYTGKDMEIIHASGFVRINSLNRESEIFSERLERTFVGARRVLI